MKPIKVIIASPSSLERSRAAKTLSNCPGVKILSQVGDLSQTYTDVEANRPDIVMMAKEFIDVEEFSCMKSLYYALGARWITIDAARTARKMLLFNDGGLRQEPLIETGMDAANMLNQLHNVMEIKRKHRPPVPMVISAARPAPRADRVVLIGASTGGIDALLAVLSVFPANCPPTAIVQHTGQGFSESLVRLLDRRCAARVVAAEDGMTLTTGMICVAGHQPGHLRLRKTGTFRCAIAEGPAISGHTPSVDALFQSAIGFSSHVIAALLTGMGRDGAAGLLDLRKGGARTIGQNEATSVVYGMPRVAWEMGAVQHQLPLERIGPEILRLASEPVEERLGAK
ncbi:MAG: hypothetical protein RLZZ437_527 [Pseudomonadota bacterium]|jgi:two-component system chemotaxis response regulator CheB